MYRIILQIADPTAQAPTPARLRAWAKQALQSQVAAGEITIRLASIPEITELNTTYRHKAKPTNVLSFPCELPPHIKMKTPPLGDIVICPAIVNEEAIQQGKGRDAHWAHMIVHGIFHLLGYDHEIDEEATIMETLEIKTMKILGFDNPYEARDE